MSTKTEEKTRIAALMDAGFTKAQAKIALKTADEAVAAKAPAKAKVEPKAEPLTQKEQGEALVEAQGLTFTKGRVYVTSDIIEAAVRVRKGGKPEVVTSSGVGRTKAVLIFKEDSGDVAIQNLTRPSN